MTLSRFREVNRKVDRWFHDHLVVWWLALVAIPGGAYAGGHMLLNDASVFQALLLGSVFGAIFATVTIVIQRWRRGWG